MRQPRIGIFDVVAAISALLLIYNCVLLGEVVRDHRQNLALLAGQKPRQGIAVAAQSVEAILFRDQWEAVSMRIAFALVLPAVWLRHRLRQQRYRTGMCPACGYNLTGNVSGVCPECGTVIAKKTE